MSSCEKKTNENVETKIEEFIKTLNINELMTLNKMIVERIRIFDQIDTSMEMRKYNIGEMVNFEDKNNNIIEGRIIKIKKNNINFSK